MTDLTPREVVEKLRQYDDLPSFPKISIRFLATAPGNEHLLKFMTEKPDNPIRLKSKPIGIIATHGVEETEVSIPRKWFEARGAVCHLVSPNHMEYARMSWPSSSPRIPTGFQLTRASKRSQSKTTMPSSPGRLESGSAARQPSRVVFPSKISGDRQTLGRAVPRLAGLSKREADQRSEGDGLLVDYGRHGQCGSHSAGPTCGGRRERNHQPIYLRHPAVCRCDCCST
jgi:hypothetical protein